MSLETIGANVVYTGNGATDVAYPIPFKFLSPTHIQVVVRDENTLETTLALGQFTVTESVGGLGELVTTEPWDETHQVTISRVTPTTQPIVLEDGALIPAKTLERAFDRLAMIAQETRGYTANQEVGPHAATHVLDGNDPVSISQSQVAGLVDALAAKALNATLSAHLEDTLNPHAVTKAQIGLGAVNNTADIDKPVSTATQAAIIAALDHLTEDARTGTAETLTLANDGQLVTMNNASENTLTVPPNSSVAFPLGAQIAVAQIGMGQTTLVAGAGVTILSLDDVLSFAGQGATAALVKRGTDTWLAVLGIPRFGGGGGDGANLSTTLTATTVKVDSDTGTSATIPAADASHAGVMTSDMQVKLEGVEAAADVTDAANVAAAGAVMNADVTSAGLAMIAAPDAAAQLALLLTRATAANAKAATDTTDPLTASNLSDYVAPQTLASASNATAYDVALGVNGVLALGEDTTITFSNAKPGQSGLVIISHDSGAHEVTWDSAIVESGSITTDDTKRNRCSWYYDGTDFIIAIGADIA
jgi:hypothetical protein